MTPRSHESVSRTPPPAVAVPDKRPGFVYPVLIGLALLRLWLGTLPGYPPDLVTFKIWALTAGTRGIHTIYDPMSETQGPAVPGGTNWAFGNYDYPPVYAYLLAPLGAIYGRLVPEPTGQVSTSRALNLLVKIPPLVFDLLTAALIGWIVGRLRLWKGKGARAGWSAALLYLIQPAVLFDSGTGDSRTSSSSSSSCSPSRSSFARARSGAGSPRLWPSS